MILKSYLVEKNLSLLDNYNAVLFYGENIGFKDEIKTEIKGKYKNYEQINFNQDEVIKNDKLLDEQIENISLFNKNKIIFVNEVSDKIKNKIIEITQNPNENIKIFLFSHNLEKKSGIRSHFEKSKNIATIACYQDNQRTLSEYVRKKLNGFSGLNQEIINLIIENSGNDRKVLSNEIIKINTLFLNKKITSEKILELLNEAYNVEFDKIRDSCFEGDKKKLNQNLGNLAIKSEDAYFYLNNLNQRITRLLELQNQFEIDKNIETAIENVKPKIFWKDKPSFLKQIKKWNSKKLNEAKKILVETEIQMKTKFNNYNSVLIKNLVLRIYQIANSTS